MMRYIYSTAILLTMGLLFTTCTGEGEPSETSDGQMEMPAGEHQAHEEMEMDSDEPTDGSIYNVSSRWKNRHDREVRLSDLGGKVQVVAMVYTHCEYACPRILADMKRIKDELSEDALENVGFTIISIDPERDTPQRLAEFADENGLDEERWTLLNGGQGDVLEAAALLGVKYKPVSDTDFVHSNMITVLNKKGEIAHQRKQLTNQHAETVNTIEMLAAD